ncbi:MULTISPECIES: VWA domain-containing protein [unclassified Massilia]|uniref:vWA domain-containing protein n=1 Tax=unclassified Massilia TaxID=2609279 RepID=UPI0017862BF4|nr:MULTISPECIES: VWA domain-containing protein [unclassified Massilia]MBD8529082.1 VWA domain-containing protein [Massilia sp. CFBP 13647]MBD8672476.1 VWA domain-containing protein [Massilia sp. CFBP 13721]
MRRPSAALPALAVLSLLMAACGTPVDTAQPIATTPAAPPAPPAPPPVPAPVASEQVTVTGSAIRQKSSAYGRPSPTLIYGGPFIAPGADKFPDAQANKAVLVAEQPVSTFSSDVDTASYAFVRRQLNGGRMPPAAAVRVEEMVNYFPYAYPRLATRAQPFALTTEVMPSPWQRENQLLHIAVRGFDLQAAARPPLNVVLLVDVSGSMGPPDRLPLLKQGFRLLADGLRPQDRVAIVTYASGTAVALEPTTGQDKQKIIDAIDALGAGGSTAGSEGLQRAYALAERHFDKGAVNRILLATDGDFNVGITDPRELEKFVADKRKSGVYLSILGVGSGNLNDALIQRLTQSGNGNAAYIDSLLEARKALGEELGSTMFPIANDVKMQVEFNPARVAAYRLIGYETRMLSRQDFKDDKVDAGDMGAGHTVTAIYEITPAAAAGNLVDPLRYGAGKQPAPAPAFASKSDELCFVRVRYKLPGESNSRLVEQPVRAGSARSALAAAPLDQRFAVAVAAFGQRLRGEPQVADYSYADIADLANGARGADTEGYRAEFVRLVRLTESLGKAGQAGQP